MDVMRTGCSMLGNLEPERDFTEQQNVADRLLGRHALHRQLLVSLQSRWRARRPRYR